MKIGADCLRHTLCRIAVRLFTEEQIVGILTEREHSEEREFGAKTANVGRKHGDR